MPKYAELTDSEMEGTDAAFPDDTEQELSPDHAAFLEALDRFYQRPVGNYGQNPVDPSYRAAVEKHLGQKMQEDFAQKMADLTPSNPDTTYNNSVTPSASTLAELAQKQQAQDDLRKLIYGQTE
jgi:acyl transferase domain-containing protein